MLSITPGQMASAGSYIAREWGDYGYRIEQIDSPTRAVAVFHVHSVCDGARFIVAVDKWGNTGGPVESHGYDTPERTAALDTLVAAMHEAAVAP